MIDYSVAANVNLQKANYLKYKIAKATVYTVLGAASAFLLQASGTVYDGNSTELHDFPTVVLPESEELTGLLRHIDDLSKLSRDWNSYADAESPNSVAVQEAKTILSHLLNHDAKPDRIVPSAEGGIDFIFSKGINYIDVEILNSGSILLGEFRLEDESEVHEITSDAESIQRVAAKVREFRG